MKKYLLILVPVVFASLSSFSQSEELDSSFSGDGIFSFNVPSKTKSGIGQEIAIQQNGKIVTAGRYFEDQFIFVGRVNANGTPDNTFGLNGFVKNENVLDFQKNSFPYVVDLLVQSNNKILVLGYSFNANKNEYRIILFRLNSDGSLDASFGNNGFFKNDLLNSLNVLPRKMALQQDGKILIAGVSGVNGNQLIARLNANAALDESFGDGGLVFQSPFGGLQFISYQNIAVNSQGKIVCSGSGSVSNLNYGFLAVTYTKDGKIDNSFASNGLFFNDFVTEDNDNESATYLKILDGDKILLGGNANSYQEDKRIIALARCKANGTLDNSFGTGGLSTRALRYDEFVLHDMAVANDGKIMFSGSYSFNATLWRFNANGSVDSSYNVNGQLSFTKAPLKQAELLSIAYQADDKLAAAGYLSKLNNNKCLLARFKNDASGIVANNGFANAEQNNKIAINPNPSHDFINISGLNLNSKAKVTVTNNYGAIMQSTTVENSAAININISNLQPGFYYVKIDEGGKSTQKKIIKQ